MNEDRLRALYAGAMARMPIPDEVVSLDAMMDVIERRGSESERSQTLKRILRDPRAREEFELLRAVAKAGETPRPSWTRAVLWRVAAAAVIMVGTFWAFSLLHDPADPMRGGAATLQQVLPENDIVLAASPLFVWRTVPNAVDYRIEVIDSSGAVVFEERVTDTISGGGMGKSFRLNEQFRWSITATTSDGGTVRSPVRGFWLVAPAGAR